MFAAARRRSALACFFVGTMRVLIPKSEGNENSASDCTSLDHILYSGGFVGPTLASTEGVTSLSLRLCLNKRRRVEWIISECA